MHPCTPTGQMVAVVWGFFGVAVVALPSGIIGSGLVEVIAEAKAKAKKLAQTRATKAAGSSRASGAPPTAEEMCDPTRFHDLGLAMLLPPGTVTSSNSQPQAVPGSPQTCANSGQSRVIEGENGGSGTGGVGLMKRLERAEEEARARDSLRHRGPRRDGSTPSGGALSPRSGGRNVQISSQLLDERGQLDLTSESAVRGCAALLFPGEFELSTASAKRGVKLAAELGATTAKDIAGVQQVLVRKLAREYLKARYRNGLTVEQTFAEKLSSEPGQEGRVSSSQHGEE